MASFGVLSLFRSVFSGGFWSGRGNRHTEAYGRHIDDVFVLRFSWWLEQRGYAESYRREMLKRLRNDWALLQSGRFLDVAVKGNNGKALLILLSRFLGCYSEMKRFLEESGVKWMHWNGCDVFGWLLNRSSLVAETEAWMERCKSVGLGWNVWNGLVFGFLSGLRTGEWIYALNKISREGLKGYYSPDLGCLVHATDRHFMRMTKKAYVTPISERMLQFLEEWHKRRERISWDLIRSRLRCKGLPCWTYRLRKMHATILAENGIPSEIVDLVEGRVPSSIFGKHYFSADLKKWFSKILDVLKPYEERWLLIFE
ncbi:MAG: integrase [Candidatus Bathyarchaeia archaeon]